MVAFFQIALEQQESLQLFKMASRNVVIDTPSEGETGHVYEMCENKLKRFEMYITFMNDSFYKLLMLLDHVFFYDSTVLLLKLKGELKI